MNLKQSLVLVSESIQRSNLLGLLQIPFETTAPIGEEIYDGSLSAQEQIENIAEQKARSVRHLYPNKTLIAADTVILCDDEILGKPIDADDAFKMLRKLSGRVHQVITGVCIINNDTVDVFSNTTSIEFYEMSDAEIQAYVDGGEPFGRSGSYSIQSGASLFLKRVEGDLNSVVGLPIGQVYQHLKQL